MGRQLFLDADLFPGKADIHGRKAADQPDAAAFAHCFSRHTDADPSLHCKKTLPKLIGKGMQGMLGKGKQDIGDFLFIGPHPQDMLFPLCIKHRPLSGAQPKLFGHGKARLRFQFFRKEEGKYLKISSVILPCSFIFCLFMYMAALQMLFL